MKRNNFGLAQNPGKDILGDFYGLFYRLANQLLSEFLVRFGHTNKLRDKHKKCVGRTFCVRRTFCVGRMFCVGRNYVSEGHFSYYVNEKFKNILFLKLIQSLAKHS